MSRDNYNQGSGKMGNNKNQNQMVRDAAKQMGVDASKLSALVHEQKDDWYDGDLSYDDLLALAEELKKK